MAVPSFDRYTTFINRHLVRLLIGDLRKLPTGVSPKYDDRLTRTEAQRIDAWAFARPEFRAAWRDKANPAHASVRILGQLLYFYGYELKCRQDENGEPLKWAVAKTVAEEKAGEERARRAYVEANPNYLALVDAKDERGAAVRRTDAVRPAISLDEGGAEPPMRQEGNATMSKTIAELMIAKLMQAPAYADKRHPDHQRAVDAVTRVYGNTPAAELEGGSDQSPRGQREALRGAVAAWTREKYGTLPARTAVAGGPGAQIASSKIAARYADKAFMDRYHDAHHPEHGGAVAEMTQLFETAHPAPAAPVEGA